MALPPIDMSADLEESTPDLEAEDEMLEDEEALDDEDMGSDVDPMFAADIAEAFPDMDDAQMAALQRAVLGLISGGGAPPAPAAPPMGF
jgi:hypothetical protein